MARRRETAVRPELVNQPKFDASSGAFRDLSTGSIDYPGKNVVPPTRLQLLAEVFGSDGSWGHYVYGTKVVGKGKNKILVPRAVPWKGLFLVAAVISGGYIIERCVILVANWWPGSKLAAASWSAITAPVTFGQWVAQHLNVNHGMTVIQSAVSPSGSGALSALQSAIPSPYAGQQATYGGNLYIYLNNAWQSLNQAT